MKKKKISKKTLVIPDQLAETYKELFDAFLKKGFTADQSFQFVLVMMGHYYGSIA